MLTQIFTGDYVDLTQICTLGRPVRNTTNEQYSFSIVYKAGLHVEIVFDVREWEKEANKFIQDVVEGQELVGGMQEEDIMHISIVRNNSNLSYEKPDYRGLTPSNIAKDKLQKNFILRKASKEIGILVNLVNNSK